MIKAILFDFNGVIIDDEHIQMEAYKDVFADDGIDLTEEKYFACLGMSDQVFIKTIYEREGKTVANEKLPVLIEAKTDKWREKIDGNIPIFEGMEDFIKRLENDFTLGLVSMARRPEIDFVLEKTGLGKSFSVIVSAEDVGSVKPDPECYREGFRRVDLHRTSNGKNPLTRKECVVIEDSPPGIVSGKLNRLRTLGVTNTVSADEMRKVGADVVTDKLTDWFPNSFRSVFK